MRILIVDERVAPDLVLLDIDMPDLNGLDVLATLRVTHDSLTTLNSALTERGQLHEHPHRHRIVSTVKESEANPGIGNGLRRLNNRRPSCKKRNRHFI